MLTFLKTTQQMIFNYVNYLPFSFLSGFVIFFFRNKQHLINRNNNNIQRKVSCAIFMQKWCIFLCFYRSFFKQRTQTKNWHGSDDQTKQREGTSNGRIKRQLIFFFFWMKLLRDWLLPKIGVRHRLRLSFTLNQNIS